MGFPCGSAGKESAYIAGDLGWKNPLDEGRLSTPIFLAGKFQGVYNPRGSQRDTT